MNINWLTSLFVGLWGDRMRFLAAGGIALLLWILLGEKVDDEEKFNLDVRTLSGDAQPLGSGLFIRIPESLAFSDVMPGDVDIELRGPAAELSRLEGTLRGFLDVSPDVLGDRQSETREVRVRGDFKFPQLDSLRVSIVNEPTIALTLSRRSPGTITLGKANLSFEPASLGDGIDVEFKPSLLTASGPHGQIQSLKADASQFRLTTIGPRELELGLADKLFVRARHGTFDNESLNRVDFLEREDIAGEDLVLIKFSKRQELIHLKFEGVEVTPLVPRAAQRDGIRKEKPLGFDPAMVDIEVTIPKDANGQRDELRAQVARDMNVFVDLGDMPFTSLAGHLRVRVEGLPAGAKVKVTPEVIDVHWNEAEALEEPE